MAPHFQGSVKERALVKTEKYFLFDEKSIRKGKDIIKGKNGAKGKESWEPSG